MKNSTPTFTAILIYAQLDSGDLSIKFHQPVPNSSVEWLNQRSLMRRVRDKLTSNLEEGFEACPHSPGRAKQAPR